MASGGRKTYDAWKESVYRQIPIQKVRNWIFFKSDKSKSLGRELDSTDFFTLTALSFEPNDTRDIACSCSRSLTLPLKLINSELAPCSTSEEDRDLANDFSVRLASSIFGKLLVNSSPFWSKVDRR